MSWKEVSIMTARREFVELANQAEVNIRELCRRFQISSRTGYKWLKRFQQQGIEGLVDHSRQPLHSPERCGAAIEQRVLSARDQHPAWGARKIRARLEVLGQQQLPAASTIHAILNRHGRIDPVESATTQNLAAWPATTV